MHNRIQTQDIAGKDQPLDLHGWHQPFAKNEKELETLIKTVRLYNQDIEMEFGIEKYAMLVMKSVKRHITEGVDLPNQNARRKRNLQILGDVGSWHHRTSGNEKKIFKRVCQKSQEITRYKTL